jgi:GNAT superfamily N-acetyltransferase
MSITIRQATSRDIEDVLALYAQLDMDDGKVSPLAEAQKVFAQFALYPNYRLFVAQNGGIIVGTYALLIMHNLAHQCTPSAIAEDVVVSQAHRGQGIGRQMMAHAVDHARKAGCYKLALSSNAKRKDAHAFYESLGFAQHGLSFVINTSI